MDIDIDKNEITWIFDGYVCDKVTPTIKLKDFDLYPTVTVFKQG